MNNEQEAFQMRQRERTPQMASEIKDSGARRDFGTGSVRDRSIGKGDPSLLPFRAIQLAALQMERGKSK